MLHHTWGAEKDASQMVKDVRLVRIYIEKQFNSKNFFFFFKFLTSSHVGGSRSKQELENFLKVWSSWYFLTAYQHFTVANSRVACVTRSQWNDWSTMAKLPPSYLRSAKSNSRRQCWHVSIKRTYSQGCYLKSYLQKMTRLPSTVVTPLTVSLELFKRTKKWRCHTSVGLKLKPKASSDKREKI